MNKAFAVQIRESIQHGLENIAHFGRS